MKLAADRLLAQLRDAKSRLLPVYLVSGDEPLLVNEVLDALRAAAVAAGCEERESHVADKSFDWDAIGGSLRNLSLFATGKLVEVRLPGASPGDEGSKALRALSAREPDGNVVLVITAKITGKVADSAWVKALDAGGAWVDTRPPGLAELPAWIRRRLKAAGLAADDEGVKLLADRVEGNLLAAQQEIDKLALLNGPGTIIDAAAMRAAVADGARFDVFQLADAALGGDAERALRVLGGLREEDTAPALVIWSLLREALVLVDAGVRSARDPEPSRALQAMGVWRSRFDLYAAALRRHKPGTLRRLLHQACVAEQVVKGSRPGDAWSALVELTLALAGRPFRAAELA